MTGAGAIVGTPAFMPPELATGEPCDARSDLYSLGVILYLLGSGRLPFMSESVHELLALHASDDPAPPMTGVPERLAKVIDKLLCKRPADRYQSAVEARTALEEALTPSTPVPGPPGGWPNDTMPSLGPFPATTGQFEGMQTPIPPSLVAETSTRKKPSNTAVQRMMTGETMLAASGDPVAATSQPGVSAPGLAAPARRRRWPLIAGAGAVAVASIAAIAMTLGGGGGGGGKHAPAPMPPPDEHVDNPGTAPVGTTDQPADEPTDEPVDKPTDQPVDKPTDQPTDQPTTDVTVTPTDKRTDAATRPPKGNRPPKPNRPPVTGSAQVKPPTSNAGSAATTVKPPTTTTTVKPPATGSGGSGKPVALPF